MVCLNLLHLYFCACKAKENNHDFVNQISIKSVFLYPFTLLIFCFCGAKGFCADLAVKPNVNAERQMYLKRLSSVIDYKPQSKVEALYYARLSQFLSQNELATELLYSSASLNTHDYMRVQRQMESNLLNRPSVDLKFLGQLVKNNVDIKGRVELGGKIAGAGAGIELEVDLGGVTKDFIGDLTQNLIPQTDRSKIDYTLTHFLNADPKALAEKWSHKDYIRDWSLKDRGFYIVDPNETVCEVRNGKPINEGSVTAHQQLQALKDTLKNVQNGEQGGCWFTDQYGLISGVKGQRFQFYQKDNIDPVTGEDHSFDPVFKPMCAVFVTGVEELHFLWEKWDEPTKRSICLSADFEFIYESSMGFFDIEDYATRIYYLEEEGVKKGKTPRLVSAKKYIDRLWDMTSLTEEEAENIGYYLEQVEYSSVGSIIYGNRDYHPSLHALVDKHGRTDKWYLKYSIKINNTDNKEDIGEQQWVGNDYSNRDSIGICKKYACLKTKPKIHADRAGWMRRSEQQIKSAQSVLGHNIKSLFSSEYFGSQSANAKEHTYPGLVRAILSLDTMARAGYGNDLEGQPHLARLLQNALALKDTLMLDESTPIELIQAVNVAVGSIKQNLTDNGVINLPIEPIDYSAPPVGLGDPELRYKALDIIANSHINPKECHYVNAPTGGAKDHRSPEDSESQDIGSRSLEDRHPKENGNPEEEADLKPVLETENDSSDEVPKEVLEEEPPNRQELQNEREEEGAGENAEPERIIISYYPIRGVNLTIIKEG